MVKITKKEISIFRFMRTQFKSCPYSLPPNFVFKSKKRKCFVYNYSLLELHEIYIKKHNFLYLSYVIYCADKNIEPYDKIDFYYYASIISKKIDLELVRCIVE